MSDEQYSWHEHDDIEQATSEHEHDGLDVHVHRRDGSIDYFPRPVKVHEGRMDCRCATPIPTPTDMCAKCLRVNAAAVRARREQAG